MRLSPLSFCLRVSLESNLFWLGELAPSAGKSGLPLSRVPSNYCPYSNTKTVLMSAWKIYFFGGWQCHLSPAAFIGSSNFQWYHRSQKHECNEKCDVEAFSNAKALKCGMYVNRNDLEVLNVDGIHSLQNLAGRVAWMDYLIFETAEIWWLKPLFTSQEILTSADIVES